jgi:cytochrome b involved in lipid metabolism
MSKEYDIDELEKHDESAERQWLAINGDVVDITEYKHEHPGSDDILLEHAGSDATESFENVGHGKEARQKLQTLVIGKLKGVKKAAPSTKSTTKTETKEGLPAVVKFVVFPAVIFAGVYFFTNVRLFINYH